MKMAEEMLPRLRVADWLDRAEAAQRQLEHLDLRDLRSVVAASDDPLVARDESTRELATDAQGGARHQAGRGARRCGSPTSRPPSTSAASCAPCACRRCRRRPACRSPAPWRPGSPRRRRRRCSPTDGPDRWAAVLEAAAFSPVRTLVAPTAPAEAKSDDLLATVKRLGPLLPQVAALFGVEVPPNAPSPKPLRPTPRRDAPKKAAEEAGRPPRARAAPAPRAGGREARRRGGRRRPPRRPIEPVAEPEAGRRRRRDPPRRRRPPPSVRPRPTSDEPTRHRRDPTEEPRRRTAPDADADRGRRPPPRSPARCRRPAAEPGGRRRRDAADTAPDETTVTDEAPSPVPSRGRRGRRDRAGGARPTRLRSSAGGRHRAAGPRPPTMRRRPCRRRRRRSGDRRRHRGRPARGAGRRRHPAGRRPRALTIGVSPASECFGAGPPAASTRMHETLGCGGAGTCSVQSGGCRRSSRTRRTGASRSSR